jgi:hypothetical protein
MPNQYAPRPTLDQEAVRSHFRTALRYRTPAAMWTALADIPILLAELDRALSLATEARTEFANLLAAARAAEAAGSEYGDESESVYLLRDELAAHEPITAEEIDEWSWR